MPVSVFDTASAPTVVSSVLPTGIRQDRLHRLDTGADVL
jgi:hypothetical protein